MARASSKLSCGMKVDDETIRWCSWLLVVSSLRSSTIGRVVRLRSVSNGHGGGEGLSFVSWLGVSRRVAWGTTSHGEEVVLMICEWVNGRRHSC